MSDPFRDGLSPEDQSWLDAIRQHNAVERARRLRREAPARSFLRRLLDALADRAASGTEENQS